MKTAILSTLLLLCAGFAALAGIPEPDNVVYGRITLGGTAVTAANSNVVVEARRSPEGSPLASYQMGSVAAAGDYYSLRIPVESLPPVTNPSASQSGQSLFLVVRDETGVRDQKSVVVGERGHLILVDFGNVDSNANGLPDDWERQNFGALGVDPSADPDHDGRSNLQEYRDGTNPRVADTRHPADNSPTNNVITINEVTAYGLAWKTGKPWPVPPATIPIDYVTRAGTLWKGGENYKLDINVSASAPLWWVNTSAPSGGSVGASKIHSASVAVNSASRSVTREDLGLRVLLLATPIQGVEAWAVEETIPAGMTAGDIAEGGVAEGAKIRWGPFFDNAERTLAYRLDPDSGCPDLVSFAGVASFDGGSVDVGGRLQLSRSGAGAWLAATVKPGGYGVELALTGEPGRVYVVEVSDNLSGWTELARLTPDETGVAQLTETAERPPVNRYFRARSEN